MRKKIIFFLLIILLGALPLRLVLAETEFEPVGDNRNFAVPNPNAGTGPIGAADFGTLVTNVIDIALLSIGSLAVIFLIVGGFRYVTSFGNEEQTENAKKIIQFSILGLVITFLAFVIVRIISTVLLQGSFGLNI